MGSSAPNGKRDSARTIPAIYLGWPAPLTPLYWRFYAIKHQREDLLAHTVPALEFSRDRIRALPEGSVVVTRPSGQIDLQIDAMLAAGELARRDAVHAADGTPAFWLLHVGAPSRPF